MAETGYISLRLEEIEGYDSLQLGTQIAVKKPFEKLHKSLKVFYPVIASEKYYYHHGVVIGEDRVIHFAGNNKKDAKPRTCTLLEFVRGAEGGILFQVKYDDQSIVLLVEKTLALAQLVLELPQNWPEYDPFKNNCESLATMLKTGKLFSNQGVKAKSRLNTTATTGCVVSGVVVLGGGYACCQFCS